MTRPGSVDAADSANADADLAVPPPSGAADASFRDLLDSITAAGASYAALLHQNGVSIAEAKASASEPYKRDELAILATALIASGQALARSLGSEPSGVIRQQLKDGGLVLQPLTEQHWLFVVASDGLTLASAEAILPTLSPALQSLLVANPSAAAARFMDDIEFADLSDLEFD